MAEELAQEAVGQQESPSVPQQNKTKRYVTIGSCAFVAVFVLFCIARSLIISIFINPQGTANGRVLSEPELQACNLGWQKLATEIQTEFQRTVSKPADLRLQKNYWNKWHHDWKKRVDDQQENCLTNRKQGQEKWLNNIRAIDRGYQQMMKSYLKIVLPEIILEDELTK